MEPLPFAFNVCTYLCVDTEESDEGVEYPLMGSLSADERRIFYWRLALVLMITSKRCNPNQRHVIITNDKADVVYQGQDLRAWLAVHGIETAYLPFKAFRWPKGTSKRFTNAYYKLECQGLMATWGKPSILLDTDVVWARRDAGLEQALAAGQTLMYDPHERGADPDSRQYGATSMRDFGNIFRELDPTYPNPTPVALGGEVAAASPAVCAEIYRDCLHGFNLVVERLHKGQPLPDEPRGLHLVNSADTLLSFGVCRRTDLVWINPWLKRMYNIGFLNNLKPGDEQKPLWHLPGEKHRGLSNLYAFIMEGDPRFWQADDEARARFLGAVCGVPRRTIRRSTDPSWWQEQVRIAKGRAGIWRGKVLQRLGLFHHR